MGEKKNLLIIIGSVLTLSIIVGISYAYWYLTKTQTGENVITTGCLKLSLKNEENDISLIEALPINDTDAENLTPYTFSLENTCSSSEYYQISLEDLTGTDLNDQYVRVKLNDTLKNLDEFGSIDKTLDNAISSRQLEVGELEGNTSKNYSLRLWLDGEKSTDEESMEKTFKSKITISVAKEEFETISAKAWTAVTGDGTQVGDEIAVGDEHFYVISNDGTTLNALAKYNLNVGSNKNPNVTEGIQDESVLGSKSGATKYGNVVFSNNKGWPYDNNDDINIKEYVGPVKTALYDEDTGYESYIQQTVPSATVRLITKSELEGLGCSGYSCSGAPAWVYSTSYWSGSANSFSTSFVWNVDSGGGFSYSSFSSGGDFGVRPVIILES